MILSNKEIRLAMIGIFALIFVPLTSFKSQDTPKYLSEREVVIIETKQIQREVSKVKDTIAVIDAQLHYRDSVIELNKSHYRRIK